MSSGHRNLSNRQPIFPGVIVILTVLIMALTLIPVSPFLTNPKAEAFSFGGIINLSNTSGGDSLLPQVALSGNNVYVVWQDNDPGNSEVFFAASLDGGITFSVPLNLSNSPGDESVDPQISSIQDNVLVIWREFVGGGSKSDIFFTMSSDNGTTFSDPIRISDSVERFSTAPQIAASNGNLYTVWTEDVSGNETNYDVFFAASLDGGTTFSAPMNISNSSTQSSTPQVVTSGTDMIYAIWKEFDGSAFVGDVFFTASIDSGDSFSEPSKVSGSLAGDAFDPQISVSNNNNIYIVWGDAMNLDTFFTVSTDGGSTFIDPPINISNSGNVFNASPALSSHDDMIYIVWQDDLPGLTDIFFIKSDDSGGSFDSTIDISNTNSSSSLTPRLDVSATSGNIYVTWWESETSDLSFSVSTDGGSTFIDPPINISNSGSTDSTARILVSDAKMHIVWQETSAGTGFDIFAKTIIDSGEPSLSIDPISNADPKWGIDPVSISGQVNGNASDTISIEWGDGTMNTEIAITGLSWTSFPVTHIYNASNVGGITITVRLLDEFGNDKASAASELDVQKHKTDLKLDNIFSVIQGDDIKVSGSLVDTDSGEPLDAKTVTFSGTGAAEILSPAISDSEGLYSSVGSSPDVVSDNPLTVQAHFAGDSAFEASFSDIIEYDTVADGTPEFLVPAGDPSGPINLIGFNASIIFDNVLSSGSIFVSRCDPPSSSRYTEIEGMCLKIAPALEVAEGSAAHVTISYNGLDIPAGYSEDLIALFHRNTSGTVDITESIDITGNAVTGSTTDFSRFIGGIALHASPQVGVVRHQIYVGDDNDLIFEFNEVRQTSFAESELTMKGTNIVTVNDPYLNLDSGEIDTVDAIISSTSEPIGIMVALHETGVDTGVFTGTFSLTTRASSVSGAELHAADGDTIKGTYEAAGMPSLRVVINGVIEAGLAEAVNYKIPSAFNTAVDIFDLRLVDAQLGPGANVTAIMSYRDFDEVSDPLQLGMALMDGTSCLDVISSSTNDGIDTTNKTIKGNATRIGQFALVLDDHIPADQECSALGFPPGGGGGGLPRPGTGIVLDAAAAVAESVSSSAGGGGGGGTRSTSAVQIPSGSNIETSLHAGTSSITIGFETVEPSSGQIKIETVDISSLSEMFDRLTTLQGNEIGIVMLDDGTSYSTSGKVFDIDASAIKFQGMVRVTIPYNEEIALSSFESNVRFLHYDEDRHEWEDRTVAVDTEENTVTGMMNSFSSVVAGLVDDGTFPPIYFDMNPQSRIMTDNRPHVLDNLHKGEQISIPMTFKNVQRANQQYATIMQILDENGVALHISWQSGTLARGESIEDFSSWTPERVGSYKVQILVWDGLDNPSALSQVVVKNINVL